MFAHSIDEIKNNIEKTAIKAGRLAEDIRLIGVSKSISVDEIKAALNLGLKDIGENRVQELEKKYSKLDQGVNWHLIGHLQRNKVKDVIDKVEYIHSVDSVRLAKRINNQAARHDIIMKILIQINLSGETTKFGLKADQLKGVLEEISTFENIQVKGLMTMAPYTLDAEENRKYFRQLKKLSVDIDNQKIHNICMEELSMGMSNDYLVAIEEGATMVRVGTALFGDRD